MKMSKNLRLRLITSFLNRAASFAIVPFMAIFLVTIFGLKTAGIIGVIQVVISYASNLIGGYLGDTYDAHHLIFWTQITQAITQFVIGILILCSASVWAIIVLYFVNIVVSNMYKSTFTSLLIASVNEVNKNKAYMWDYISVNISLAVGVSIGALLFGKLQYLVFMISATVVLIVALTLNYAFDYTIIGQKTNHSHYSTFKNEISNLINSYKTPIKDTVFLKYVLGTALITASPFALDTLGQVHFNQYFSSDTLRFWGITNGTQLFGLTQIENVIIIFVGTVIFSKYIHEVKNKTLLIMLVVYVLSYNVVYNSNNIEIIIVMIFMGSIAELGYASFIQSMQVELIPNEHRAKYLSFNSLGNYISKLIGSLSLIVLSTSNMLITTLILLTFSLIGVFMVMKIKNTMSK